MAEDLGGVLEDFKEIKFKLEDMITKQKQSEQSFLNDSS